MEKVAALMRQGISQSKPTKGTLLYMYNDELYACALGCVVIAANLQEWRSSLWAEVARLTGENMFDFIKHPLKPNSAPMTVFSIVTDLNDRQEWTREQIAEWLETVPNN